MAYFEEKSNLVLRPFQITLSKAFFAIKKTKQNKTLNLNVSTAFP